MNGELFDLQPSEPDRLTKARLEYERALNKLELCHTRAIEANEAQIDADAARKELERAKLQLEHAERWEASRRA